MRALMIGLAVLIAGCGSDTARRDGSGIDYADQSVLPGSDGSSAPMDLSVAIPDLANTGDMATPVDMPDLAMMPMTGCKGLAACIQGCKGNNVCDTACRTNATKMAKKLYATLEACILMACPIRPPDGGVSDGGAEPCAMQNSATCRMCRMQSIMPAGACAMPYMACETNLP